MDVAYVNLEKVRYIHTQVNFLLHMKTNGIFWSYIILLAILNLELKIKCSGINIVKIGKIIKIKKVSIIYVNEM